MLSKNKARFIISLQKKKTREEEGLYVIEGDKIVREFLASGVPLKMLVAKPEFIKSIPQVPESCEIAEANFEDLRQISTLKTPHNALAIVGIPENKPDIKEILDDLCVTLEFVQDPGNLGTIIRAAGWFGINNIVCSPDCVDAYNPKVVQASMGALLHVNLYYSDLHNILNEAAIRKIPIYGTVLEGNSIYKHSLSNMGVIMLGNESKGISADLLPYITDRIMIPGFSQAKAGLDSLNVGMAASIVFSEFRRRHPS